MHTAKICNIPHSRRLTFGAITATCTPEMDLSFATLLVTVSMNSAYLCNSNLSCWAALEEDFGQAVQRQTPASAYFSICGLDVQGFELLWYCLQRRWA